MNDAALAVPNRRFDLAMLLAGAALALALLGFVAGFGWHGGFIAAQQASRVLPDWLWEILTTLGDGRVQLALMLPFCLRYPRVFWALALGALVAALISRGFKAGLPMPRPAAVFDAGQITVIGAVLKAHSFPSGHTVSAFSFVVAWLALLGWRAWPLLGLAALAGFSRIAVGAHWPVDVLAGALIGVLGGWLGLRLSRRLRWGLGVRAHWLLVGIGAAAVATLPFDGQGYPDTLAWRLLATAWGLGGGAWIYLRPLLRDGWQAANRPLAGVQSPDAKA